MSHPTISVIIPTCDRPSLFEEALASVRAQSVAPCEVLVINNGTVPLPDEARKQATVVDIMPYAGAAQARNFGALLAQGDYLAFLDDDDLWESSYLEKAGRLIDEHHPDLIVTRLDRLANGKVEPYRDVSKVADLYTAVLTTNPGVGGPNSVVKKSAFMAVGGYDVQLITSEDRALYIELHRHGYRIVTAGHIQAIAREHSAERLTDRAKMIEGKERFLRKYHRLMPPAVRLRNRAIINYQKFRHRYLPWHLLLTGWYLALAYLRSARS